MPQKKIKFKQRIKRNDQKQRHLAAAGMRKRMGVTRRSHNRYDFIDNGSRPMEEMMAEIAEGTAIPTREFGLDPRSLTDLLMKPSPSTVTSSAAATGGPSSSKGKKTTSAAASSSALRPSAPVKPQLPTQLPADHPLALADTNALEEEERRQRLEQESLKAQQANKNQYRHAGQPYVFWERAGVHPTIIQALRAMKFSHPTPVQQEVLTHVLDPDADVASPEQRKRDEEEEENERNAATGEDGEAGGEGSKSNSMKRRKKRKSTNGPGGAALSNEDRDVIVSAETGSGKTLVFAIPVLNDLLKYIDAQAAAAGKRIHVPEAVTGATTTKADGDEEEDVDHEEEEEEGGDDEEALSSAKKTKRSDKGKKRGRGSDTSTQKKGSKAEPAKKRRTGQATEAKAITAAETDPNIFVEDFQRRVMHTLIVSPTRELAIQINEAFRLLTKFCPHVTVGCIVGGMAQEKQQRVLNRHPHILICSPGRLWDLVEKNEGCYLGHSISRRLHYVVLDEADKLLQSGKFEQLKSMLERIHSDILPAGFIQKREEGAEVGEMELETGRWDEEKKQFVPYTKDEKEAMAKGKAASTKDVKKKNKTKSKKNDDSAEDDDEEDFEDDEEDDEETSGQAKKTPLKKKDQPRPIPMPADPDGNHRVVTYVTSATLSLQTNYERRDYKSDKKIIRTNNADVMGKVLQQLEIKPSSANVFTISPQADVAAKINETYLRCPDKSKDLYLYYFLRTYQDDRTIIFVNAISMLRRLVKVLECLGISVVGLHASMQQRQRLKFIDKFKAGTIKVLVATDVASRGLDIDGLKYVLHFQVPRTTEAYIHRCGRTARCGGTGLSLLMVSAAEHVSFRKLMESLGRKESAMEQFALQPTVVHQLHAHLRIALQIDKLQKEMDKTRASDRWVDRMNKAAELDVDDMKDEETAELNREKTKAIRILKRELELMQKKFTGSFGGKGAFRTGAQAMGARQAEEKLRERADRQTLKLHK